MYVCGASRATQAGQFPGGAVLNCAPNYDNRPKVNRTMAYIDVFNGDADGICALTQIRNAERVESTLVTGVKRDIELLKQVNAAPGDKITVLDVSMDKNRAGVERALEAGAEVFYVDHHFAGEIPQHPNMRAIINEAPDVPVNNHSNTSRPSEIRDNCGEVPASNERDVFTGGSLRPDSNIAFS